jgi:MFS family permease
LAFGISSDYWSRKWSLFISTIILIVFAALGAASYGYHDSQTGLFAALTAYRFFLGIGIGGEYPAGSVACAESTGELESGSRNRWFIIFTDFMIDSGFVVAAIVPTILVAIFTEDHLRAVWRICLGLGVIPPLSLLWLRYKLKEPEEFNRERMRSYPYLLILKYVHLFLFLIFVLLMKNLIMANNMPDITGSDWFVSLIGAVMCVVFANLSNSPSSA